MNVYLVSRIDTISYCENMECIVVASDELWAEKIARLKVSDFRKAPLFVEKVNIDEEGVLLVTNMGA